MEFMKVVYDKRKDLVYPDFTVPKTHTNYMVRGGQFYAYYPENNETGRWITNQKELISLMDDELKKEAERRGAGVQLVSDFNNGYLEKFVRFNKVLDDDFKVLDRKITFKSQKTKRDDYISKSVPYDLVEGSYESWEKIIGTLYEPEEREKIEWAIGAVLTGESSKIQKFLVFYGPPGSGKSTILNIIDMLTKGYNSMFTSADLGDNRNQFSLEPFTSNPLIAIEHDGDLSRMNTNTRLNSIVSHERIVFNEKHKKQYIMKVDSFLFIGTNSPVQITDSKSGIIRRLIDVIPSGNKLPPKEYDKLMKQVEYELGPISYHCIEVYKSKGAKAYSKYEPTIMMKATDYIYDFMIDIYDEIKDSEYVTLAFLWSKFQNYAQENNLSIVNYRRIKFTDNIRSYFKEEYDYYKKMGHTFVGLDKARIERGIRRYDKDLEVTEEHAVKGNDTTAQQDNPDWLQLKKQKSQFDIFEKDSIAQYANEDGTRPCVKWDNCKTRLCELDTSKLHFVKPADEHHIFVDFDIKDKDGNKSLSENIKRAVELGLPPTYAETSKSGGGLHLHYIYDGDIRQLSSVMDDNVEIKVFPSDKKSSMRRKLTLCNNLPIAHISSGLPLRKECQKDVINTDMEITERHVRKTIKRCINKEYEKMPKTVMNVMFIKKLLDDLYSSGKSYDCSDMFHVVHTFASSSNNSAGKCLELVADMKWCSKDYEQKDEGIIPLDISHKEEEDDRPMTFFDVEVFPNLFVICWKHHGNPEIVRMINPTPNEVKELFKFKLVGFNNREYDNHILYAAANGYSNAALYKVSTGIIGGDKNAKFGNAYNLSYTDIFDFSNDKKSLKKWEIALGIHHLELGIPWDKPVPEELWDKVAEYCCNDVDATEALFDHLEDTDWTTRIILSELSGLSRNETTNNHTCQIIFGNDKTPQKEFIYTDLSKEFPGYKFNPYEPDAKKKSTYRGYYTKEGGYADGIEGIWYDVALLDIASMHPTTAKELQIFGPRYTPRYYSLVETRLHIKHGEEEEARAMFDGAIGRIIDKYNLSIKKIDKALKIPINAVYGLTSAKFKNRCRDPRNVDNIVAKRGALFMITLRDEVRKLGYEVVHVKTDSVKIPNATPEIIKFVMDFGKKYGYTFEHEATYERMCLVNHAVYISKYASKEWCADKYGYIPDKNNDYAGEWTATGTQFQVPYVFKELFSHQTIEFEDLCVINEVKHPAAIYLRREGMEDQFIGRIGQFCPVDEIGGDLMRVDKEANKEGAVTGTKGFKWLESEYVKINGLQDHVDRGYYRILCDKAKETIEQYGSFDEFVAG